MSDEAHLPYGKQFSPSQIHGSLRALLELVRDAGGDPKAAHVAIGKALFAKPSDPKAEQTLGMNTYLSLRSYGLVTDGDPYALTGVATDLLKCTSDAEMMTVFARHLILKCHGAQLIEVVESLRARGDEVKVATVSRELLALGVNPGGTSGEHVNPIRMWLERGGVLKDRWTVDAGRYEELVGTTPAGVSELTSMPLPHRAVMHALATITEPAPHLGSTLRELAELQMPGLAIDLKSFVKKVLDPLQAAGWITHSRTTGGSGAKSQLVAPTQQFHDLISDPLTDMVLSQVHLQDPASLRRPINDLLAIVDSRASSHKRGQALEGVCIQLLRLMGARFVDWRQRGVETGGAEVDLVAESIGAPYLLIQVQSKASAITGRDRIDREVGVASSLKSNAILFVTAKRVGPAARRAAAVYMQETNLAILFLDGTDLRGGAPSVIVAMAREWQAVRAVRAGRGHQRAADLES